MSTRSLLYRPFKLPEDVHKESPHKGMWWVRSAYVVNQARAAQAVLFFARGRVFKKTSSIVLFITARKIAIGVFMPCPHHLKQLQVSHTITPQNARWTEQILEL